jgi:hypothetical protein
VKLEYYVVGLIKMKMISWKIHMIMEFLFGYYAIQGTNENMLLFWLVFSFKEFLFVAKVVIIPWKI